MLKTNICILGAGPGGVAAALQLDRLGYDCILVDKAKFPRDKVCGDAISGKVVWAFNQIDKSIFERYRNESEQHQVPCWGIELIFTNDKVLSVPFLSKFQELNLSEEKPVGYVAKRLDFDHFLIREVKNSRHINFLEEKHFNKAEKTETGWKLESESGEFIETKILIVANGAQSKIARQLGALKMDKKHHSGAIRAYMSGVKGLNEHNFIEFNSVLND
jgi:flavin-dependent dehydrogenase